MDLATLLDELAHTPHLNGAPCRNNAAVFDAPNPRAIAIAQDICRACPAQKCCADRLHSLPEALRPQGIVAGELLRHTPRQGDGAADWIGELTTRRQVPNIESRRDSAAQWLRAQLADGPMTSDEIQQAGREAGYQRHVLFWARKRIGAVATHSDGYGRHTLWRLQQ